MKTSKWAKGVQEYAAELYQNMIDNNLPITEENLLNGAKNWKEYSLGGSSLVYDCDIAERLATPSEVKACTRKDSSLRNPNKNETWLDVQARALYQAAQQLLQPIK